MQIDPSIFKAYDIRGVYPEQVNEPFAYALGRSYATFIKKELNGVENIKIAVGADGRISSPSLKQELIKGLTDSGLHVVDIGTVSTPTFYFGVAELKVNGGIQVSASHNPKQYNGFKVVRNAAIPVSRDTGLQTLKEIIETESFIPLSDAKGNIEEVNNILEAEVSDVISRAGNLDYKKYNIVIDAANSVGGLDMEALFAVLTGVNTTFINAELDGNFPGHEADPMKEENLVQLKEKIKEVGADFGIAPDGDGDRIFFIDEKGEIVMPSILRGLLAQIELKKHPGSLVAYDIRPGKITQDMIDELGGKALVTPVGHSLIKEAMIKEGAVFGGESSGHFFYKLPYGTFESPMTVVLDVLRYLSDSGKSFSEVITPYKKYFHSGEINVKVESRVVIDKVLTEIKEKYKDGKLVTIDGVSIEYPDVWFNVRSSNTEPLLRFTIEAKDKTKMEQMRDELLSLVK